MRRLGSDFELKQERDMEMLSVFRYYMSFPNNLPLPEIVKIILDTPTSRFWVTEERAAIVLMSLEKGESISYMSPTKQEMYQELYKRMKALRATNPNAAIVDIARHIVQQPAPKLYMTLSSAIVTLHRIRKKCREQQLRK